MKQPKPETQAMQRDLLRSAALNVFAEKPLTREERHLICEIAHDVLDGHDPRKLLGIKKVSGPRRGGDLYDFFIATYFWALRLHEPKLLAKAAAIEVAQACGITPLRVQKIARRQRVHAQDLVDRDPQYDHIGLSRSMLGLSDRTPIPHK